MQIVDIAIGESVKLQQLMHYLRLLIYLLRHHRQYDFVHYYSTMLVLLGPWLGHLAGLPSLVTVTGFGRVFSNSKLKFRLLRPVYRILFALSVYLSRAVLFQNRADLEIVASWFPRHQNKLLYVGSAVEVPVCEEKDFFACPLRVLLVARLLPDKGIDDFLKVAERLQGDALEFLLVGPVSVGFDDLADRVFAAADRELITYTGRLNAAETQQQFARSHIFFFPSSYGEGLARVMLEAGFARLCPIAYNIPANRDLVWEGQGFLVETGDIEHAIEILRFLSSERNELKKQAIAYQKHIMTDYNMVAFARRQDDLLLNLFGEQAMCKKETND